MADQTITILGGSTPFIVSFFEALAARNWQKSARMLLYGRNGDNLSVLAQYGQARLGKIGWTVQGTQNLEEALDGVEIVINHIRFGGMQFRAVGERIANEHGVLADESIGPPALLAALCAASPLAELAQKLTSACPDAWVLNLTNPVGLATAHLSSLGVARCVGLCEVPLVTAQQMTTQLGLDFEKLRWHYTGLNHRGFLHSFEHDDEGDVLGAYRNALRESESGADEVSDIDALGAVPTKYFRYYRGRGQPTQGRAQQLEELRGKILDQLRRDATAMPLASLQRKSDWYPLALVPALVGLINDSPELFFGSAVGASAICHEHKSHFKGRELSMQDGAQPPAPVGEWLARFAKQEEAAFAAVQNPSYERVLEAMRLDPLVGEKLAPPVADDIWKAWRGAP
jgi:6-phospho-beta-glucosidase